MQSGLKNLHDSGLHLDIVGKSVHPRTPSWVRSAPVLYTKKTQHNCKDQVPFRQVSQHTYNPRPNPRSFSFNSTRNDSTSGSDPRLPQRVQRCSIRSGSKWRPVSQEIMAQSSIPMHQLQSCASEQGSQSALSAPVAEHIALDVREHIDNDKIDRVGLQEFVTLNEIEADRLKEIEGDVRLRLILSDWKNRLRESQERKERKLRLSLNVKNEIYQLIGFFSVFQGVVLTTVAQASQLTCHNWWGPFALSLLASFTTLVGVGNKFHNFIKWKRATDFEIENSKVLKGQISRLKKFGADFKFSEHAKDVLRKKKESGTQFKRYYILAVLVIVSMMGFSVIMLISCQRILCDKGPA